MRRRVEEALDQVALSKRAASQYPHHLSGGQRQRAAIARALIVDPSVLVCDEVTSALDVSIQAVIVELLDRLQRERGISMLFVTHNLPLIRSVAQQVAVMQSGRIVELGAVKDVLQRPQAAETSRLIKDAPHFRQA
jgi:peptide/nickel transport system ATP-binding protein